MSIIKEANSLMESYANSPTGYMSTLDAAEIIEGLLEKLDQTQKELQGYKDGFEVIKKYVQDSYYGHEEVNLTPIGRVAIEEALSKLKGDKQ